MIIGKRVTLMCRMNIHRENLPNSIKVPNALKVLTGQL